MLWHRFHLGCWFACGCVLAAHAPSSAAEEPPAPLFPFVLPWNDASAGPTSVAAWLEKPAGKNGPITARNGHLYAGSKRIRLFGVNLCFGADFPEHDQAEQIAARMAKFGINCVRFHHMDMRSAPGGILAADGRALDPGQLDRLDYLIAELKKNGIYADLNLHVSRTYPDLPTWQGMPSFHKGVDQFVTRMIEWQRDYARDLLTHENRYTHTRYVDEPSVALVEINNENALLHEWSGGGLDRMPSVYAEELQAAWNEWLGRHYPDFEALKKAWTERGLRAGDQPGKVAIFLKRDFGSRPEAAQRDWIGFLWEAEERYWTGMYRYLKDDLKVRCPILGTQMGWSPFPIQAQLDVIDSHAYWQHPRFPGRPWDMDNWTVQNIPMAGRPDGGTLPRLALTRVAGKPFICTEYNHAAPNTYSSEAMLLLAGFAALQDWDGIFAFAYSHRSGDWDARKISSFFDIDQHPAKMVTLPAAAALFLRGDLQPPAERLLATPTRAQVIERVRRAGPYVGADAFGIDRLAALAGPVAVRLGDGSAPSKQKESHAPRAWLWRPDGKPIVMIDTPRSKALIGSVAQGESYRLGDVIVRPKTSRQGWAAITLTALDAPDFRSPGRVLITATGYAENTAMGWKNPEHTTLGRDWGQAPALVEGIGAKIELPIPARDLKAWRLDERGQRSTPIDVNALENGVSVEIAPRYQTLWYELEIGGRPPQPR